MSLTQLIRSYHNKAWGINPQLLKHVLSGTSVRVFQSCYTIAIVYRLMFFMYRKVLRYTLQNMPELGYRKIRLEECC